MEKGTNPCLPHTRKYDLSNAGNFKDAWLEGKSTGNGFTFSNMVNFRMHTVHVHNCKTESPKPQIIYDAD